MHDCGSPVCKIGEQLPNVWRREIEPLSIILLYHLLEKWYQGYDPLQQSYAITAQWIQKCYSHQVPHMKVLEIGAGTRSCTIPPLEALSVGNHSLLSRYTFTDISAGFFLEELEIELNIEASS